MYDVRAVQALDDLECPSPKGSYGNYMGTVLEFLEEVNQQGLKWYPRDVDKALYILGGGFGQS